MTAVPKTAIGLFAAALLAVNPPMFLLLAGVTSLIAITRWLELRRRRRPKQLPPPPGPIHTIPIEERGRYRE